MSNTMVVKTGRFGQLNLSDDEVIHMPNGLLGFPDLSRFCLEPSRARLWSMNVKNKADGPLG